jgi:hypothetical protein
MPWSFYTTLLSFGLFFSTLNIYILTEILNHPAASPLWLVGVIVGFVALLYSIRMVRIHQVELVAQRRSEEQDS